MRGGQCAGRRDLRVSQQLLAVAAQMPLLVEALHHDAHRARFVLPVDEPADLRIGFLRQVRIYRFQRRCGGELLAEVERPARDDVDIARNAAFDEIGGCALAHDHLAHELGRQQREADAAPDGLHLVEDEPVARRDRVPVDERLGQARVRAAQADAVVLVEAAFASRRRADRDAGNALHGVGDVPVGELADVVGRHHVDDGIGIALGFKRALQRKPETGDRNRFARKQRWRCRRRRRGGGLRENLRFPLRGLRVGGCLGVFRGGRLRSVLRLVLRRLRGCRVGLCLALGRVDRTGSRLLRVHGRDDAHQRDCDGRCDRCFPELHEPPLDRIRTKNYDAKILRTAAGITSLLFCGDQCHYTTTWSKHATNP